MKLRRDKTKIARRRRRFPIVRTSIAAVVTAVGALAIFDAVKDRSNKVS